MSADAGNRADEPDSVNESPATGNDPGHEMHDSWQHPADGTLEDGIVRLRALRPDDSETTLAWRNDPGVWARTMGFRLPITESMERQWYAALAADNGLTRVVLGIEAIGAGPSRPRGAENREPTHLLVGFVQLNEIDWPSRTASFGMVVGAAEHRNKGYGRRTLVLATRYAAHQLGLRKLNLKVVGFNSEAITLYRSEGWIEEGHQADQFFVNGALHGVVLMGRFLP